MGNVVESLLTITKHTLGLYRSKESRKYLDRTIYLEKLYYVEKNKPDDSINHAVLDNIAAELCILSNAITKFGKPTIED